MTDKTSVQAPPLKVVLVDDHAAVRTSLKQLLELKGIYQVIGEGSNGAEAVERVEQLEPDIVLIDMNMPVMNGAEATRIIKSRHPDIQVLALTAFADMTLVSEMVKAGASGYLLKGGTAAELMESLRAVSNGHGALDKEVTRGVMEDMADLYRKEQDRAAALEELDRMKSEFVSVVSHELRTPITTIKGGILTLLNRGAEIDADIQAELLVSMQRNCDRLTDMIGRILTVSGLQRGGLGLNPLTFDLGAIAHDALKMVQSGLGERPVEVKVERALVSGDQQRLTEITVALLENAVQFTTGAIGVTVSAESGFCRLHIVDEGPGMNATTIERLLQEPFSQGDSSSTRRVGGLGLSLYMARRVLEASGGRLEVATAPDTGSTFAMVLPQAPA